MKQFIKQHKYHLIVLILLLVITVISWKITNYQPTSSVDMSPITNEIQNDEQKTNNNQQTSDNSYQTTKQKIASSNSTETTTYDLKLTTDNLQLTTYELKANDYTISSSTTVYNLMQFASADSRQPFLFETKDYGSMGLFIESINGLENNLQTGEYWIYYVNGESAKIGISNYIVKPGDVIQWRYEKSNF